MNKKLRISPKKIWFALNGVLLNLLVISSIIGAEDIFGVCGTLIILLSFPCNLLVGWLFFAFGSFYALPGVMLLMMFVFSIIGYFQWFVLVPQIVKFVRLNFFKHDVRINFKVNVENTKQLTEPNIETAGTQEWQTNWYDEQKRTPVERVFNRDVN